MRDIFLQPFDNRLLGCVAGTYIIMLIAMATVIYAAKTLLHDENEKHVGIGESALWCLSIMCMQGLFLPFIIKQLRCNDLSLSLFQNTTLIQIIYNNT